MSSKTYDDDQRHPSGITGKDVIPDTHDHTDVELTQRGPCHGATHYIPGDGFLISHGGFSRKSKGTVYEEKKEEILSKRPKGGLPPMHDEGTYLSESEILRLAGVIHTHRKMTGAKGAKEQVFEEARARKHAGTDAVDSSKDGFHKQSDQFDIDKSRSTIFIGMTSIGPPGMALNGSKVYHQYAVHLILTTPDGRMLCDVMLSPEQFAMALVGNSYTPCTMTSYWNISEDSALLQERVRPPESIRKRMEKRLRHRLKEQTEALQEITQEMVNQAATGKPARKTKLNEWAERVARAVEHSASNSAFTVQQAQEEVTSIVESAGIQFLGQQNLDARTLWEAAGAALGMDEDDIKRITETEKDS